ncbi:MAG: disulfide oxidoreductase [Acidimicrobiia bacterium]|nr:MAG: disulfide oxidoreductase [Acidimicrobiia bacterium]
MTVDAVSTFLAVGSLLLLACVVAVWVVRLLALASERSRRVWESVLASMSGQGARLALLMATVAMLGSLYFSEIAGFIPCEYCWYQRIAMYPLVVILAVGLIGRDERVHRYVYPLASIGALIAAYHYSIQRFPDLASGACSTLVPCTTAYVWKFDLVSIPFMAFVSFAVIITVLLLDRGETVPQPEPEEDPVT